MRLARLLPVTLALTLLVAAAGCSVGRTVGHVGNAGKTFMLLQDFGPMLNQSRGDHMHRINAVIDRDARAFFHDLDLLYQTERPTRLTPWHDR